MSDRRTILIQLDPDPQPSSFDRVVAIDAGVDEVFSYGSVRAEQVEPLVHGAIFTRGPEDLKRTAIFVGGMDVAAGEELLQRVLKSFIGPMRVSVMLDANGANTTAAAAVHAARRHLELSSATALVLGGTGPVGQRSALLLAHQGADVRLASRSQRRADAAATAVCEAVGSDRVSGYETYDDDTIGAALEGADLVISAGAAGVRLLPRDCWEDAKALKVAIDLNAVPPLGIEGIEVVDKATERSGISCYGAIGVGGTKMKIHKAAIRSLFESNDKVLDAETIFDLGMGEGGA